MPRPKNPQTRIQFRTPVELANWFREYTARQNVSMSQVIKGYLESLKHHDEHADAQMTRPSTSAVQLPPPGDWKIGASPSMDEFLIRKLQALSTEIERWFGPLKNRGADELESIYKQFSADYENVLQPLNGSQLTESTRPLIYTGLILLEICRNSQKLMPICLPSLIQQIQQSHPSLCGASVSVEAIKNTFLTHLPGVYREEDEPLIGLVYDIEAEHGRISVLDTKEREKFRAWLPFGCLDQPPQKGDRYRLVVWALWRYWYGAEGTRMV